MKRTLFAIYVLIVLVSAISFTSYIFSVIAEDLESQNYKLLDPKFSTGGQTTDSQSGTYKLLGVAGDSIETKRLNSAIYSLGSGHGYTFMANVPKVACADATSDGSSSCSGLGSGMVQICGPTGCYDRARFEIDTQNNPDDTLYSVQISPDNWNTIYYLDGDTHTLESSSTHNINDYKTKSQWEQSDNGNDWSNINILGLKPGTTYHIRIAAIHGDFTESPYGPELTFTTSYPVISLDLDTAHDMTGESNAPYTLKLELVPDSVVTSDKNIYVDFETNAVGGGQVYIKDSNAGLASNTYTINSISGDLASLNEGYGVKLNATNEDATGPGYLVGGSKYLTANDTSVGDLQTTSNVMLCSKKTDEADCSVGDSGPLKSGRAEVLVKAKVSYNTPSEDYSDTITFEAMADW